MSRRRKAEKNAMFMVGKSSCDGIRIDPDIANPVIFLSRFPTTVRCLLTALLKGSFPLILGFIAEGVSNNLCFLSHGFTVILSPFWTKLSPSSPILSRIDVWRNFSISGID